MESLLMCVTGVLIMQICVMYRRIDRRNAKITRKKIEREMKKIINKRFESRKKIYDSYGWIS